MNRNENTEMSAISSWMFGSIENIYMAYSAFSNRLDLHTYLRPMNKGIIYTCAKYRGQTQTTRNAWLV
jgi:hypothetical protein